MRIKYIVYFIVFLSVLKGTNLRAQDPSFTQFVFNKLYFNPAFCGDNKGFALGITGRSLWQSVPSGFYTSKVSADWNIPVYNKSMGIGLIGISDVEGEGYLSNYSLGLPIAFKVDIQKNVFSFRFGLQASVFQNSINWNHLTFSNQFDPINGLVRSSGIEQNTENEDQIVKVDFASGCIFEYRNKGAKNWSVRLGAAGYHLTRPDISYYKTGRLPIKMVYHIDGSVFFNKKNIFSLNPAFVVENQSKMQTVVLGSNFSFYPNLSNHSFFAGLWYRRWRNADAIDLTVGCRFNNLGSWNMLLYYNYDLTGSNLATVSGGSHEVGIAFEFDRSKRFKINKMAAKNCSTESNSGVRRKARIKRSGKKNRINKKSETNILGL